MQSVSNSIGFTYDSIADAFPEVDAGVTPFGSRILVQLRRPKSVTRGGIILTTDNRETEFWNTQVAKVIAMGPGAFKNRDTLTVWPEGEWCQPGEFVRVPKYGGDRWTVPTGTKDAFTGNDDEVVVVIFNDLDVLGMITGDPRNVKAFY